MPKIIELSGTVGWDITAKDLKKKLPNTGEEVLLKIDSPGGSVFEGNRLYNTLNDHLNTFPGSVKVELGAIAASAASYFPLAVGAKNIKVRSNTTFMGHKAWTFSIGNSDDMKAEAEILDGFDKIIAKVYSKVTGKTAEESLEDMKNEFWLIGGQSVVDAGFASEIIDDDYTEESEESEIVDKVEILAKIEEAKNQLREVENNEDLNKWAAKIDEVLNSTDVDNGQNLLFRESKNSVSAGEKNMRGDKMNLNDLLAANPEAKAEHERLIAAETNRVDTAINEDRERSAKILALSGNKLPDNVLASIKGGDSVGDFATKEIENRNTEISNQTPEETEIGKLEVSNQMPAGEKT
ncbi:MAG: Clp protease ClpP, partial [Alphaproteobacteria bacterium]|nr:Clp protease ClpP [Alphaproteobacteria bacterium]